MVSLSALVFAFSHEYEASTSIEESFKHLYRIMVTFKVIALTALATTALADAATFNYASQAKHVHASLQPPFPFPSLNFHITVPILTSSSPLARYAAQNQAHQGPTAPPCQTSPLSGQAPNAVVQLTPQNAADKTPLAGTAAPHVLKQPAGNASKCVIREGTAVQLFGESGIALLCRLLMRVRVRSRTIIARRRCLQMRGVVRMGLMRMYLFQFFSWAEGS
jgi:hypothetical protein